MAKNIKKNLIGLFIIIIFAAGLLGFDVYRDRQHKVIVKELMPVYTDWEPYPPKDQKPEFILTQQDVVKVKRIRHGKDYMAVRIETRDGKSGWVLPNKNCLVVE